MLINVNKKKEESTKICFGLEKLVSLAKSDFLRGRK